MDTYTPTTPLGKNEESDIYFNREHHIREHLRTVISEDVYDKWIEHFVFEKIDSQKVVVGYYGTESLKKFKKSYREMVCVHMRPIVGEVKKLKIYKRKSKTTKPQTTKTQTKKEKKNIKVAKLFIISLLFAAITLGIAVIGCNYISNRSFKESFYSVSSLKANNKIRIIQISDLHGSSYGKDNNKLISRVEKLKPDLIIYTGDCLDFDDNSTNEVIKLCSELTKVAPSYYIYGNNEIEKYYDTPLNQDALDKKFGFNDDNREPQKLLDIADDFEKELEASGVKVLKNEIDSIVIGSTNVDVYGVLTSNPSSFWSYAGDSFDEFIYTNVNNLKVTAIHEPLVCEEYSPDSWGDVMLCGHTHGGTVRIPMFGPLYTHEGGLLPEKDGCFVYGRYDVSGTPLIVSSGLDNKNIFRINNNPELVVVDVNKF